MHAGVLYESMYGNTRAIAEQIAAGLTGFDATLVPVGTATAETIEGADLVVVGAPTHAFGLSSPRTRVAAERQAALAHGAFTLEPGALGGGAREWLAALPRGRQLVAAFDTRIRGAGFAGHAAPRIARRLRTRGYRVIAAPHSFFVTKDNVLRPSELADAHAWGQALAAMVESGFPTAPHGLEGR